MLFLIGSLVGVFAVAGSDPLLRLLRGDVDPDLRARRGLGRAGPHEGDADVRALHDGRLAADARRDHRLRDLAGDVPARGDRDELERPDLPRLHGRLRREGAAPPLPRLAPRRVHRGAARGRGAPLGCRLEGGGVRPRLDRAPPLPPAGRRLAQRRARPRRGDARLRLRPRLPPAGRARRDRVLVDGPDGPDRARHLRGQRPRARRRRSCTRSATGSSRPASSSSPG